MIKLSESLYVNKAFITAIEFLDAWDDEDGYHPDQAWIHMAGAQSQHVEGEALAILRRYLDHEAEGW